VAYTFVEQITQPLYDTARVGPGTTAFFGEPVGYGRTVFGDGPKHYGDTNMFLSHQMPLVAGWAFVMRGIVAEPLGGPIPAGAAIELVLGAKTYLTIPATRAALSLTVTESQAVRAERLIEMVQGVDPSAFAMLLGSVPGVSIGFDLVQPYALKASIFFVVRVVMPTDAPANIVRIYLNGGMGRSVQ
jgi:hypothetical protein